MITAVNTKRGGGRKRATEVLSAATRKQKVGELGRATDRRYADLPSGEYSCETDAAAAAGETTNGRAKSVAKPNGKSRGRSKTKRGAGEKMPEADRFGAGSADTENGAAAITPQSQLCVPRRSNKRGKGGTPSATEMTGARPAESNGRAKPITKPINGLHSQSVGGEDAGDFDSCTAICRQLIPLQRARVAALRMRIRVDNGIGSFVASQLGDNASLDDADRQKLRKIADELVSCVWKAKPLKHTEHEAVIAANLGMIEAAGIGSRAFQSQIDLFEKQMERLVKQLPLAAWLDEPEQRGIGYVSVAKIIGECGDLSDYRNPSCVWKRMGCAPYQGKMPSTWRFGKEGKASSEDWVAMGYNPRRRSLMYVVGEGIVKQNGDGPYRKRYDEAKVTFAEKHPDYSKGRCHSHAMLLASKLLLKNLWIQMRGESA